MRHVLYKTALLCSAVPAAILLASGSAVAQEPQQSGTTASGDTVVVTGSRIGRDPNLASPVPVQSVSAEQIQDAGEFNLADVVNDVPALLASTTSENSATGANFLNLRGMGGERTLTLVNGRRHVAGFEGNQAVDIGSIPAQLVDRVEVLTGGASAVYGSDAVTGVVNFVLRDDYEGANLRVSGGFPEEGSGSYRSIQGLLGKNFHDDRGNVVFSFEVRSDSGLRRGDRDWAAGNAGSRGQPNPALRFQNGDIDAGATPNLAAYYDFATTGRYHYGLRIPTEASFIARYTSQFGVAPSLTQAERALFERAANAPSRAILPFPTFSISSNRGVIAPADFDLGGVDLDGNGTDDCLDSFVGWNSGFFGTGAFGLAGGCWVVDEGGNVRPYRDGLVSSDFNHFGGDGIPDDFDLDYLVPRDDVYTFNFNAGYQFTSRTRGFVELKYSQSNTQIGGPLNTFYDLLYGAPDNPYLPAELAAVTARAGGLFITRDPTDLGPNIDNLERETMRFVGGLEGTLSNGWSWEVAYNYGQFVRTTTNNNFVILDRFFAAIDAVRDASGNIVCRSDVDPAAIPPTTIFGIPAFDPGIYTFQPGDGLCQPANIWGGPSSISPQAVDFITTTVVDELTLDQSVFSAVMVGDLGQFFTLPAGPIGFAVGAEYREETSENIVNPYNRGVLPATSATPGVLVSTISDNGSLGFNAEGQFFNSAGSYDVTDLYAEISVPLMAGVPLARELTLDGAFRYADYSTIGAAETWKVGVVYSPFNDLTFRGTISQAIRAPNIDELFGPDSPATFRPVDPCDATEIPNAPDPALRAANCLADGLPASYVDPLSARFLGVAGGNPGLQEETADTTTLGLVYQPGFLDGLSITVDYWDVEISDAISAVSAQDIVDNCYDSTTFPNEFCTLFTRNRDAASPQFGGFNFLRQTSINFASIRASGVDFAVNYGFDWGQNEFGVRLVGSKQEKLDFYTNPSDPNQVDPELGEIQRPEWAGTVDLTWARDVWRLGWQVQYQSEQTLSGVEIETADTLYGPAGIVDEFYSHRVYGSYAVSDRVSINGGISNLTDEVPFSTEEAWPIGPRGRTFFFGIDLTWG